MIILCFRQYVTKGQKVLGVFFYSIYMQYLKEKRLFNPLMSAFHTFVVKHFLPAYFFYRYLCKFYTRESCLSRTQNQFIINTTQFRSNYGPKSRFCPRKTVHFGGALLKKRKRFFDISLLNGYRYHKFLTDSSPQILRAIKK